MPAGDANPTALTVEQMAGLATQYGVPVEDVVLIAVNLYGIASNIPRHRARIVVRLAGVPTVPWQVIVPLNAANSPFRLDAGTLTAGGEFVATVERVDADEAVGGYFRDNGRAVTLNPNARSRCVGCAFCPNTLEAAADPRMAEEKDVSDLLTAMAQQHPLGTLADLSEVTVSTGCFEQERAAVDHLAALRRTLTAHGVGARIGFLSSVLRSREAFNELAKQTTPFVLRLTAECFTRRDLLLKASKATLQTAEMPHVLEHAREAGHGASFTYIVGLDDFDAMCSGVASLAPQVTEFPNFQVYQAHNSIMAGLRQPGAGEVEFYLQARIAIEDILGTAGLRPRGWECYRPLWYFTFAGQELVGR